MTGARRDLVRAAYAQARAITREHGRTFYLTSFLLFGARRRAAYALYGVLRRMDDAVDEPGGKEPVTVPDSLSPAFEDAVRRFGVPPQALRDFELGMRMDLTRSRYASWAELDIYCYRVAGTVGLMMAPILGCSDPRALAAADTLGRAMQLTNILRDVGEDLDRGRIYLPEDELRAFGVTEDALFEGRVDQRFVELMRFQIARARGLYADALDGIAALWAPGAQRMVTLMAAAYGDILRAIELRGYDVLHGRAVVPARRKLALLAAALLWPSAVQRGIRRIAARAAAPSVATVHRLELKAANDDVARGAA